MDKYKRYRKTEQRFEKTLKALTVIGLVLLALTILITPLGLLIWALGGITLGNVLLGAAKWLGSAMLFDFIFLGFTILIAGLWMYVISKRA